MEKTGITLITHKRFDYCKQVLQSLANNNFGGAHSLVIVQDGDYYSKKEKQELLQLSNNFKGDFEFITLPTNKGVATAKNTGIKKLQEKNCEHLFTLEDDILITNPKVCEEYINFAKKKGLKHLNFALHGPMNKGRKKDYYGIPVYPHCVGAWSYYHKTIFETIGYFNEQMINAFEHVYHTLLISNQLLTTPFWLFADIPNNNECLKEIPGSIDNSSIRPRKDWRENIEKAQKIIIEETGRFLPPKPNFWNEEIKQ